MNETQDLDEIGKWLKFFQECGDCYKEIFLRPLWEGYQKKYKKDKTDFWVSLLIFVEGYAFERQGSDRSYPHVGVDIIENLTNQELDSKEIWDMFEELCKKSGIRLNIKENPFYPSNNPKGIKGINKQKKSIIEFVRDRHIGENDDSKSLSLVTYITKKLGENSIQNVFNELKKIRGIGNKIASFYLRDLVTIYENEINLPQETEDENKKDITEDKEDKKKRYKKIIEARSLLQPIDIWVRRTINELLNKEEAIRGIISEMKQSIIEELKNERININKDCLSINIEIIKEECIKRWIVKRSLLDYNLNPEKVNMGIWFFCSQIVESKYRLHKIISENKFDSALKSIEKLLEDLANKKQKKEQIECMEKILKIYKSNQK